MADERVLLVDDDHDFTDVLSQRLAARGIRVQTADSGESAVKLAESTSYDAVVIDLLMPGMDGIATMKRLLSEDPDLQIILLTGHGSLEKGVEAVKLGAMDFLEKPANIDVLMAKVREAAANRVMIVSERMEERIKGILQAKGW